MLLGGTSGLEGPEVATLLGFRVDLSRIQAVFAASQFANHGRYLAVACELEVEILPASTERFCQKHAGSGRYFHALHFFARTEF